MSLTAPFDAETFIVSRLLVRLVPDRPDILLYQAHAGSRLGQMSTAGAAPYWAYSWAGGLALAQHMLAFPEIVAGKRVLDLGSGSGLVAIAAALAGADSVVAAERDLAGVTAIGLNAALNGVAVEVGSGDVLSDVVPDCDVILAGDIFYAPEVATEALDFLERCHNAGLSVQIGDPGRTDLPLARLSKIATYRVHDVGLPPDGRVDGHVFDLA